MANPKVRFKRSSVAGKIPNETQVPLGEIAINTYDGKIFSSRNVGVGTTVFVVNPWSVGAGTDVYNTYFTSGNVGIGTASPPDELTVLGRVQIQQDSGSNNRLVFRAKPGNSFRWSIDNDGASNDFRIFREDDITTANGVVYLGISTTGTVSATRFSGDGSLLTGITASSSGVIVQNQGSTVGTASTLNFSTNLTASFASGTATISLSNNPVISGILTADQVYTSNNGNGTNVRIGDDLWIGDINVANTIRLSGTNDPSKAFIVFGNSNTVALGRTGSGPLYYGGDFTIAGVSTANSFRARGGSPGGLGVNNNGYGFFGSGDNDSGMYSSADGQIEFYSNSSEVVRIAAGGNVGIGTTNPTSALTVKGNTSLETLNVSGVATVSQLFTDHSLLVSGILTTVSTSQTTLVSYPLATYRSAKLNVQISCGSTHRITELLMVHNGTEIFMTEYGSISTTEANFEVSNLASFTSDINSGNFRILATPASAGLTTFKYVSNLITV